MAENMSFLPKADVLTLEEIDRLCSTFVGLGVRKLRLTGGGTVSSQKYHVVGPEPCQTPREWDAG